MYKGNVEDFANRVIDYIRETYDVRLNFYPSTQYPKHWYLSDGIHRTYPDCYVQDTESFEDDIYRAVNWILNRRKERGYHDHKRDN